MTVNRRDAFALAGLTLGGAALTAGSAQAQASDAVTVAHPGRYAPGVPGRDYTPVVTPNNAALPFRVVDGVKVFHLIAEEVDHEFAPGLRAQCWGYNGRVHGPTIEAVEGDRVRIYVTNRLIAGTTVHWHGLILPSGMDGVGGLSQPVIRPGQTFVYEYTLVQHGTHMYHSHHDEMTQIGMGMSGLFVIHPRRPRRRVDREYAYLLSEWDIRPGSRRPNPNEMTDFNVLTLNAKVFPATAPIVAERGERVRLRIANNSPQNHHPIHLHGHTFKVTATDGGQIPEVGQWPEVTAVVPVGSSRDIEFTAIPGDWALHCHMTHHVMNQMGHDAPNMVGVDASQIDRRARDVLPGYITMGSDGMAEHGEHVEGGLPVPANSIPMVGGRGQHDYITMGGMFTILKVRERLQGAADPGWYRDRPGELARLATAAELGRDGIPT